MADLLLADVIVVVAGSGSILRIEDYRAARERSRTLAQPHCATSVDAFRPGAAISRMQCLALGAAWSRRGASGC